MVRYPSGPRTASMIYRARRLVIWFAARPQEPDFARDS